MMEAAVEQAAAASRPIQLIANPTYWDDALDNQAAFADEARLVPPPPPPPPQQEPGPGAGAGAGPALRPVTTMPRMRKCHGWLALKGDTFRGFPWWLRPPILKVSKLTRLIQHDREYTAIVYEYVEEGENDADAVQKALDFFRLAGFARTMSLLAKNWKSSVLLDLCDIVSPRSYGWHGQRYKPTTSAFLLDPRSNMDDHDPVNAFRPLDLRSQPNSRQPGKRPSHSPSPAPPPLPP
jgi:hypothetical protein